MSVVSSIIITAAVASGMTQSKAQNRIEQFTSQQELYKSRWFRNEIKPQLDKLEKQGNELATKELTQFNDFQKGNSRKDISKQRAENSRKQNELKGSVEEVEHRIRKEAASKTGRFGTRRGNAVLAQEKAGQSPKVIPNALSNVIDE